MNPAAAPPVPRSPARSRMPSPSHRRPLQPPRRPRLSWAVLVAVFVCLAACALAAAPAETLILDDRSPVWDGEKWVMLSEHDAQWRRVQKRASETSETSESSEPSESPTATSDRGSVTTTFSISFKTSEPSATSSTTVSASPLPSILDSLPSDFSPGPNGEPPPCPVFINSFLSDPTFKECYPLSMLLDRSRSFFEAQKSLVSITRTLDATCAANATFCGRYLAGLARELTAPGNCGADYERGRPSVVDAHRAMLAYAPVYGAGCLRDRATSAYCFARAVTNLTNPSAAYVYFLPLNRTLPGSSAPACDQCLRDTMALYHAATADRSQPIASTYLDAARQVNTVCGPGFANDSLAPEAVTSAAAAAAAAVSGRWLPPALTLLAAVLWLG